MLKDVSDLRLTNFNLSSTSILGATEPKGSLKENTRYG